MFINIFSRSGRLTKGEIVQFRSLELLIIIQICLYAFQWADYISSLSSVQFPAGIANYLNISFLFHYPYALYNAFLISVFCIIGYFRGSKYSYLIAVALTHLQYVARFSQGKLSHGSVLAGLTFLLIAITIFFFRKEKIRIRTANGLIIFFVGLAYVSAALCKLIASGIHWPNGFHLWLWIIEKSIDQLSQNGIVTYSIIQHLALNNWLISTSILSMGLFIECLGFCLWFPKTRPYISTAIIGMHIGIYSLLNINFNDNIYLLILVGYPWYKLFDQIAKQLKTSSKLNWLFRSN